MNCGADSYTTKREDKMPADDDDSACLHDMDEPAECCDHGVPFDTVCEECEEELLNDEL